jgi:hypothetical protein
MALISLVAVFLLVLVKQTQAEVEVVVGMESQVLLAVLAS